MAALHCIGDALSDAALQLSGCKFVKFENEQIRVEFTGQILVVPPFQCGLNRLKLVSVAHIVVKGGVKGMVKTGFT